MAGLTHTYSNITGEYKSKTPPSRLQFSVGFSRTFYVYIIKYIRRKFYNNKVTFYFLSCGLFFFSIQ